MLTSLKRDTDNSMAIRTSLWSLWLPIGIEVVFALGDFSYGIYDDRPLENFISLITFLFPLMWLLGMPLTLAVQLIHRRSRTLAFAVAAICAPLSVAAFFLSVPLPSFLNTLFGAALAWLMLGLLYLRIALQRVRWPATGREQ